jgi:ABC-type dipeptide/oligopeptide/nickel transport system permease component
MKKRIISRLIMLTVVLFGVTLLTFFYTSLSPVDAGQALAVRRYTRPTEEQVTQVRHELGLDQPLAKQYTDWLGRALRGDFGNSYNTGKPIIDELTASLKPTVTLALLSLLFTVLLSIPLGVLSASRKGGFADKTIYLFGIVCMSVPNYWIGFMLMLAFAVQLPWFGIMGAENLRDLVLPSLAAAIPTAAANIRVFRSSLLDGYNSDFVMYARARGISERKIAGMVSRYALPPLVTLLGQSFGFTIAGSAMIEFVFSIPGVGSMLVTALGSRDTVTVNACVLVIAVIFVAVNFLAEVINAFLNPKEQTKERAYA